MSFLTGLPSPILSIMGRNRKEYERYRVVSAKQNVSEEEVKRILASFFSIIFCDARSLPFDNPRRIFSKDKFDEYVEVRHIPFIGRIGPVYSNYLKWRANESQQIEMAPRSSYRSRRTQSDIESTAAAILSGMTPPPLEKKRGNEMYERVWLVGQDGKKSARQVIPKK